MAQKKVEYNEDKVKTLNSIDHIRLRPGMYIGRLGNGSNAYDGIYILLKEVIDNCIDEFIMGHGKLVEISLEDNLFTVRDYGRGIPLGKLKECVSQINTGAKYNNDVFQFSVGLNGVGTKAVNALSEYFFVESIRDGKARRIVFNDGKVINDESCSSDEENGTKVQFRASGEVFTKYKIEYKFIEQRLFHYAYLNRGLTLFFNNKKFYSRFGLKDLLSKEIDQDKLYNIIHFQERQLEFCFSHSSNYGERYFSFVNGQHTHDGGTHQTALKEGISKGINEYSNKSFDTADIREGVWACIAVKINQPVFESQTKNKLANPEIRAELVQKIKDFIVDFLHKNKEICDRILEKISHNEKVRKNILSLKKNARDKLKKASLKIPKLRDCKHHLSDKSTLGEQSQIFLTEGDSAVGSMISCRDVLTQALFPLRGKPLNVYGMKRDIIYKNEELFYIMKALQIEDSLDGLRYQKVIIATDADQDGLHIRNLLITYFLSFFEELVERGHVYVLETPIFRVRNKMKSIYCYNEKEKEKAIAELKTQVEITRFKGLGEISPKEFAPFIGKDMRLIKLANDRARKDELLKFFMGKNTLERKNFIMQNLKDVR